MFFSCERTCASRDPATDTVRINLPGAADPAQTGQGSPVAEQEIAQAAEREQEEERRRAEEDERRRAEEELRRAAQLEEEEEELRRLARLEEEEARSRAEAAAREAELAEQRRREQEGALRQERLAEVQAFLKAEGFADVGSSKRKMLRKTYPLHRAAELGNGRMVEHLLAEGADRSQKNSTGLTAAQVAAKKNKEGSHGGALRALGGA